MTNDAYILSKVTVLLSAIITATYVHSRCLFANADVIADKRCNCARWKILFASVELFKTTGTGIIVKTLLLYNLENVDLTSFLSFYYAYNQWYILLLVQTCEHIISNVSNIYRYLYFHIFSLHQRKPVHWWKDIIAMQ